MIDVNLYYKRKNIEDAIERLFNLPESVCPLIFMKMKCSKSNMNIHVQIKNYSRTLKQRILMGIFL